MLSTMSNIKIKIKAADYTVVDSDYDLLHKGCINVDPERTIKYLYSHDKKQVIGNVTKWYEQEDGLYCEVELADPNKVPLVKKALYEMENGLVDRNSIGFSYRELEYNRSEGYFDITSIELFEVSMVSIPSNPRTPFIEIIKEESGEENESPVDNFINAIIGLTF